MFLLTFFTLFVSVSLSFASAEELPPVTDTPASIPAAESNILPEEFYGTFVVDHSENFDEYLDAKGYSWITRKIVTLASFRKVFGKTADKTKFDFSNLTTMRDTHYKDVVLGKSFVGDGLDGNQQNVTFTFKDGRLFEKHVPLNENGVAKAETYAYFFERDYLVVTMECDGVEGKRYHAREE